MTTDLVASIENIDVNDTLSRITVSIQKCRTKNTDWVPTADSLLIYTKGKNNFQVNDLIYVKGARCNGPAKLNHFLRKNNYCGTAFSPQKIYLIKRPKHSLRRFIHTIKHRLYTTINKKLNPMTQSFFNSIFLGKKESKEYERLKNPFLSWGITHYLARSGLHLSSIFLIITFIGNLLLLPFLINIMLILCCCLLYASLTWPSISFNRSLLLIIGYQLCKLLKIPIDSLHLLNIVLIICIISNSYLIFALDFQLTFILTYALIYIHKKSVIPSKSLNPCT